MRRACISVAHQLSLIGRPLTARLPHVLSGRPLTTLRPPAIRQRSPAERSGPFHVISGRPLMAHVQPCPQRSSAERPCRPIPPQRMSAEGPCRSRGLSGRPLRAYTPDISPQRASAEGSSPFHVLSGRPLMRHVTPSALSGRPLTVRLTHVLSGRPLTTLHPPAIRQRSPAERSGPFHVLSGRPLTAHAHTLPSAVVR